MFFGFLQKNEDPFINNMLCTSEITLRFSALCVSIVDALSHYSLFSKTENDTWIFTFVNREFPPAQVEALFCSNMKMINNI